MAEKHKQAEKDYIKGLKYKEIAEKHEVSINTVKSWKRRHGWTREKGAPPAKSVHTKQKGGQPGNVNALGNSGGSAPKGNDNAVSHGFFRKIFPDDGETLDIVDAISQKSPVDMIWENIVIQYTAIARAQRIMFVEDKGEMIKEIKKRKRDSGDGYDVEEDEWEFQFSWDRQATFMNAQSRAMSEFRSLIKDFLQISDQDDHRRLQLQQMQVSIEKTQKEIEAISDEDKKDEGTQDWVDALKEIAEKRKQAKGEEDG